MKKQTDNYAEDSLFRKIDQRIHESERLDNLAYQIAQAEKDKDVFRKSGHSQPEKPSVTRISYRTFFQSRQAKLDELESIKTKLRELHSIRNKLLNQKQTDESLVNIENDLMDLSVEDLKENQVRYQKMIDDAKCRVQQLDLSLDKNKQKIQSLLDRQKVLQSESDESTSRKNFKELTK